MRCFVKLFAIVSLALAVLPAWAQKPSAYPAKGQSAEVKAQDDAACAAWAKQDTGIDPRRDIDGGRRRHRPAGRTRHGAPCAARPQAR